MRFVEQRHVEPDHAVLVADHVDEIVIDPDMVAVVARAALRRTREQRIDPANRHHEQETVVVLERREHRTVVAGDYSAADLMKKAKAMGGKFTLTTVEGAPLTIEMKGKHLWVVDESGNAAKITIADVKQSNGVIHVIDKVLMMKM